jgi:hypothetical protein
MKVIFVSFVFLSFLTFGATICINKRLLVWIGVDRSIVNRSVSK